MGEFCERGTGGPPAGNGDGSEPCRGEAASPDSIRAQKRLLRARLIEKRRGLDAEYRREADAAIRERLESLPAYRAAGLLFCYVSKDEEVDSRQLIADALREGKRVAVPRCGRLRDDAGADRQGAAWQGCAGTDHDGSGADQRSAGADWQGAAADGNGVAWQGCAGTDHDGSGADRQSAGADRQDAAEDGNGAAVTRCGITRGWMEACEIHSLEELRPGAYGILEPAGSCRPVPPGQIDLCIVPCLCVGSAGVRLGYGGGYYDRYLPRLRADALRVALAREKIQGTEPPSEPHDRPVDLLVTEDRVIFYENGK